MNSTLRVFPNAPPASWFHQEGRDTVLGFRFRLSSARVPPKYHKDFPPSSRRDDTRIAQPFKVGSGDFTIASVPKGRLNAFISASRVLPLLFPHNPRSARRPNVQSYSA